MSLNSVFLSWVAMVASVLLGTGAYDAMIPHISRVWMGNERERVLPMLGYLAKFVAIAGVVALAVGSLLPGITSLAYGDSTIGTYAFVILAAAAISTTFFEFSKISSQVTGRIVSLSLLTFGDHVFRFTWVLGLVLIGFGVVGAVTGHFIGALLLAGVAALVVGRIASRESGWPSVSKIIHTARIAPMRPYLADTLWVIGDRNLAMLFMALPVALAGLFVASAQVAFFKVAFGYITLALAVLGPISILLNMQFPRVQVADQKHLKREFTRISWYSVLVSASMTVVVLALAPFVIPLLYGAEYREAVPLAQAFAVHGIFFGIGVGLGPMWRALSKVRVSIFINLITLGIGIPMGLFMMRLWGVWGAVAMVTLWYLVSHMTSYFYLVRELGKR